VTLSERLDLNQGSLSPQAWETCFAQAFALLGTPQLNGAALSNVHDLLKVNMDGADAELSWEVIGMPDTKVDGV